MTKVIYYTTTQKDNPLKEFIENLEERQQRKVSRIFSNIEKYGLTTAIPHIKKLIGTPLWEIRILGQGSIRVFYAAMKRLVEWNIRMTTT